jgi:hypothetical protein
VTRAFIAATSRCGSATDGPASYKRIVAKTITLPRDNLSGPGNHSSGRAFLDGSQIWPAGAVKARSHRQSEGLIMITAAQCRSARTLRSWSLAKLAAASGVSEAAIDDFELERRQPDAATLEALQRALEGAGVAFLPGGDVRLPDEAAGCR